MFIGLVKIGAPVIASLAFVSVGFGLTAKFSPQMKPLKGKLACGPYLVVAWIDLRKGPRIGEYFYIYVPKIY